MNNQEWTRFYPEFAVNENWGNPDLMQLSFLEVLYEWRERLGFPVHINYGTNGKHVDNSLHYIGFAVDVTPLREEIPLVDVFITALQFDFTGIGIYPKWKYNNKVVGGLHLERTPLKTSRTKLWLRDNNNEYACNLENFRRFSLI